MTKIRRDTFAIEYQPTLCERFRRWRHRHKTGEVESQVVVIGHPADAFATAPNAPILPHIRPLSVLRASPMMRSLSAIEQPSGNLAAIAEEWPLTAPFMAQSRAQSASVADAAPAATPKLAPIPLPTAMPVSLPDDVAQAFALAERVLQDMLDKLYQLKNTKDAP